MTYFRVGGMRPFPALLPSFKSHGKAAFAGALAVLCCLFMSFSSAHAGPVFGDLRGFTRSAQGAPLPGAQVLVHSVDDNTDLNIVSNDQGAFLVENLRPGRYELRAAKEGLASSELTTIDLRPQEDLQVDMTLDASSGSKGTAKSSLTADLRTPAVTANSDAAPPTDREKMLLDRLDQLERRLEAIEARDAKAATTAAASVQPAAVASQPRTDGIMAATTQPAPAATPAKGAALSVAPANPMIASLNGSAGVNPKQEAKEEAMNFPLTPVPGTPSSAKPATPVVVATPAAPPQAAAADPAPKKKIDPFSDYDWTWLNGNPRTKDIYWDSKFFTPEIRSDVTATWDNQHPADHSMGGSSELFREGEVQLEQLGIGGDFHWDNVRARFMTQFGGYSTATIRNDGSYANGEWNLADANRYLSEAYGGYHFNWMYGVNFDVGIFMSYIGLFSYYNFDNWAYQPSYVSSNTPWFFQGVRVQIFPTAHLKLEPWYINGWQSYASANNRPGWGGQLKWTPKPWFNFISNNYGVGHDDLYAPSRTRLHTDNSQEIKYFDRPKYRGVDKIAVSFTEDLGCEYGNGVSCTGDHAGGPKQSFIGAMIYNRFWFDRDLFAITLGGGRINNPGRYLVLLPPINGATASSAALNTPYFTENPGDPFKAWDTSITFDWMPKQYVTFRIEPDYRHASIPYWTGRGGITPPATLGGSVLTPNGNPSAYVCMSGAAAYNATTNTDLDLADATTFCSSNGNGGLWYPNLVRSEFLIDFDVMVKF
ncbi:MAG TPA: TonB-dependent receptor [Terriglobia bacterium]|nr:TonB-dependent receptor [Terriglobia bacterium]